MQVLSHTYELNEFLTKEEGAYYKKRLKNIYDSALLVEWDNLRALMWETNCVVSPGKFIKTIQKLAQIKKMDIFTGYNQNDLANIVGLKSRASEILNRKRKLSLEMIRQLHERLNIPTDVLIQTY
jgi:antitoxin component HigA of HigAB toxin-antitoxin module